MRIASSSDERTHLAALVERELRSRGHHVELVGPPAGMPLRWTDAAWAVAENMEKLKELDRHCRAREVGAPVEGDKGRA